MKIRIRIISLSLLLALYSCAQNENASFEMADAGSMDKIAQEQVEDTDINVERKLIKEGRVEFETKNRAATQLQIAESIQKYKGYISSDQEYKYDGKVSTTLVVRIPAKSFDLFLSDATKGVAKFDSKNVDVKDVTEEFLDIEARLKTKKELENRYLEILQKATTVTEMLEVENQIGQLRSDIESIEGRLNYLKSSVSFSTLTITYYETVSDTNEFGNKFKEGFKNGWENLIWFFVYLANIWPFIFIGVAFLIGIKRWKKNK